MTSSDLQDEMEQKEAEKMSKSKNDVGTHSRLAMRGDFQRIFGYGGYGDPVWTQKRNHGDKLRSYVEDDVWFNSITL